MNPTELARRINNCLVKGIKTEADEVEVLELDKEWRRLIKECSKAEYKKFEQQSIGLESFAMIAMMIEVKHKSD